MKWNTLRIVLICLGLVALMLVGAFVAKRSYFSLRQARLLKQAEAQIENSNERKAILFLRRVLKVDPNNIEATRPLADLAERALIPPDQAFDFREVGLRR